MKKTGALFTLFLLLSGISFAFLVSTSEAENLEETIISFDLESSESDFTHGGTLDSWEWGIPGPGTTENPGPGRAGEGIRCFGSPLNGTYSKGTKSFLLLPEIDISNYMDVRMEFLLWYDLTLRSDERNESGTGKDSDYFHIDVMSGDGVWNSLVNLTSSSGGSWVRRSLDLSTLDSRSLLVRFMLVDVPDGMEDNGVFIDMITISGIVRPAIDIHFTEPPDVPSFVPSRENSRIIYSVMNRGQTIPPETYVSVEIEGPAGWQPYSESRPITEEEFQTSSFEWTPWLEGTYSISINLTIDSEVRESYGYTVYALQAVFFESFTYGADYWSLTTEKGNGSFMPSSNLSFQPSSSSGTYLSFRQGEDQKEWFEGETYAVAESSQIDLTNVGSAHMYIFHSFGFLGEEGSCGGVVQARNSEGEWITLEPDVPHTRQLTSGPLSGEEAFQGDRDWYQIGFDLSDMAGSLTYVRFVISSSPSGKGRGWMLDDIMIVGDGFDPFDREGPEPVSGLGYRVISNGTIELTWSPSFSPDLLLYRIYMGLGEPDEISEGDLLMEWDAGNGTSITVEDMDPDGSYWFAVTGVDMSGNEGRPVSISNVHPAVTEGNRPPVARIKVVGSTEGRLGDIFIFNASGSYDPDGDEIQLTWELPDGSSRTGYEVKWRSNVTGDRLTVTLIVRDSGGLESKDNVVISVSQTSERYVGFENISYFLMCMIPILIMILLVVMILAVFRARRHGKIRRELIRTMNTYSGGKVMNAEVISENPDEVVAPSSREVMDLVPIHVGKRHTPERRSTSHSRGSVEKSKKAGSTDEDLKEGGMPHRHEIDADRKNTVKAVIECPFCQKTFKMEIERKKLDGGRSLEITCPHCGRHGKT